MDLQNELAQKVADEGTPSPTAHGNLLASKREEEGPQMLSFQRDDNFSITS